MSQADFPDITPTITVTIDQTIIMLLSSIALEEMALAHLINAEAEKLQYVLGTLHGAELEPSPPDLREILTINASIQRTMHDVIMKEMLLLMKFDKVIDLVARGQNSEYQGEG